MSVKIHLLSVKMHAINKSIQNILSNGIISVPLKYRPSGIGQQSVKLIKPMANMTFQSQLASNALKTMGKKPYPMLSDNVFSKSF